MPTISIDSISCRDNATESEARSRFDHINRYVVNRATPLRMRVSTPEPSSTSTLDCNTNSTSLASSIGRPLSSSWIGTKCDAMPMQSIPMSLLVLTKEGWNEHGMQPVGNSAQLFTCSPQPTPIATSTPTNQRHCYHHHCHTRPRTLSPRPTTILHSTPRQNDRTNIHTNIDINSNDNVVLVKCCSVCHTHQHSTTE
jgi:hypothetical protein